MKNKIPVKLLVVDQGLKWVIVKADDKNNMDIKATFKAFHGHSLSRKHKVFIIPASVTGITDDFGYTIKDKALDFTWAQVL